MGAKPSFAMDSDDSVAKRLEQTGWNTGNQLIAYGLLKNLKFNDLSWDYSPGPKALSELFDIIVIAAANFLFPGFDFSEMAKFIEQTTLPCMMVGVGAQSRTFSPIIDLPEGTRRLMKVVSERSALIGVRGPFTAEVLSRMGVRNVQITGCPSYYMGGKPGITITKPDWRTDFRLAVNSSRDVIGHAFSENDMLQVTRRIGQLAIEFEADFIAQTEQDEITIAERAPDATEATNRLQNFYRGIATDAAISSWAKVHTRVFWRVEDWIAAMQNYDFVFGTRFHGAMIALQGGKPACVICHDTRTTEMCEFLSIPHVLLSEAKTISPSQLYESVDPEIISTRHAELYSLYKDFLNHNHASHRLPEAHPQRL